jgi:hypothetical protein
VGLSSLSDVLLVVFIVVESSIFGTSTARESYPVDMEAWNRETKGNECHRWLLLRISDKRDEMLSNVARVSNGCKSVKR